MSAEIYILRRSVATLIREAAAEQGKAIEHQYHPDGRNGYRVEGVWMTPGEACKALGVSWP